MPEFEIGNKRVVIEVDHFPESPRTWDNLSKIYTAHREYSIGDFSCHDRYTIEQQVCIDLGIDDYADAEKLAWIFPLFMYDHSGVTISLAPFACPFDSGQVGIVVVKKADEPDESKAREIAEGEVKTLDQYLQGEVYLCQLFEVFPDIEQDGRTYTTEPELIDSCGGFFGDHADSGILDGIASYFTPEEFKEVLKFFTK